ncbi:MAG: glycosyltransferase family 2 protein [Acidobacteriota bacterium]
MPSSPAPVEPPAPLAAGSEPELSLVVPVYNEEENLQPLVREIAAALEPAGRSYELLLIDDGSTDAGPAAMAALGKADPRIRIIRLGKNSGQSAALDAGFRFARGRIVVTLDADLQNDPADIPRMLAELSRADVVCGIRANRRDTWTRRISSRIANGVRNRLTHEHVTDVGCTLRVCRRELLQELPMFTGLHRFLPTLLKMQGGRVVEIPVNHRPRLHGVAKYGIGNRLWRALADLFAVRWMQKRWIDRRQADEVTVDRG